MAQEIPTPDEARAALAQANEARRKLGATGAYTPARNLAFGLLTAYYAAIPALSLDAIWLKVAAFVVFFAAVYAIYRWDLKRDGVFINGLRRGSTLWVSITLSIFLVAIYSAQIGLRINDKPAWMSWALVGLAFLIGYAGNAIWGRVFRREMGAE
jgi:hypothetical protein